MLSAANACREAIIISNLSQVVCAMFDVRRNRISKNDFQRGPNSNLDFGKSQTQNVDQHMKGGKNRINLNETNVSRDAGIASSLSQPACVRRPPSSQPCRRQCVEVGDADQP